MDFFNTHSFESILIHLNKFSTLKCYAMKKDCKHFKGFSRTHLSPFDSVYQRIYEFSTLIRTDTFLLYVDVEMFLIDSVERARNRSILS